MTIYVAMLFDRHSDPEAEVYTTPDAAIARARSFAEENSRDGTYEEEDIGGWLFYASYSPEGDRVWVVEKELQP